MNKFNNSKATLLTLRTQSLRRSMNMSALFCLPTDDPRHQVSIDIATPFPLANVGMVFTRLWCWLMIFPGRYECMQ
jgi:hypothetical protein